MTNEEIHEMRLKVSAVMAYAIATQEKAHALLKVLQDVKERRGREDAYLHNEGGQHEG